ncbi:MAG: pyruvate dehydrogenase (acetyl-transferring) E1 component subunit alpha [Rhodospirillales bacterium]|nr:MAG: pyruvate dehydrogenase (acetyl-transferring) E1 component subunit alpha [Rhodospirillales bacterium]
MPRHEIHPAHGVEYLQVLNEHGDLDEALDPNLSDALLHRIHRAMLLSRRFDERLLKLQRQGRIGTFATVSGQEASQIGSVAALRDSDWMVPSYREGSVSLWRGTPISGILLYTAGYNEGGAIPEGQNDLPVAIPVGSQMLHAVGIGYGINMRRDGGVVMTYFGDGATSQGDFHEAMNFAAVFRTPVVFLCQNNQWAISVPREQQTRSRTIAQKALAYGMPGLQVDGNDVLAVYAACAEAVKRAREDHEPTLIECVTYRLSVHTTADDPTKYRDDSEVEAWKRRDPIPRFQNYLKDKGLLSDDDIADLEDEIKREIEDGWKEAQARMAELTDPAHMFEHVYAEMPYALAEQRDAFRRGRPQEGDG